MIRSVSATIYRWLLSAAACLVLLVSIARADDPIHWLRGDAQLTDVTFVDAAQGWAVGDRGAIWHTADGGEHWQPQESGVDCRLASVQFLDAQTGWIVGGRTQPYRHATQGVLLVTHDGGQHWQHDRKMLLPALLAVRFLDKSHGWAVGRSSPLFTSTVFVTEDGGRSWTSLPASEPPPGQPANRSGPTADAAWTTGDFLDPFNGALAGPRGALALVRRRGIELSPSADSSLRAWHRLQLSGPRQAWAVGDGAWVMRTGDLGKSWQTPGPLPGDLRDQFDFFAIAGGGPHCWIAGAPGSRVFASADGGQTWISQPTGQTLPIRGLTFADEQHGWAVGDLGLILATSDGGQTWRPQRAGGSRAALLGCFSTPGAVPWELFARLSADEGYLGVAEILNRQDLEPSPGTQELEPRTHEALLRAGGSACELAWRFPLRQPGLSLQAEQLIDGWNRANDGRGLERLEAHVVKKIRQWRPAIVVIAQGGSGDSRPALAGSSSATTTAAAATTTADAVINSVVRQAIEHAADPTQFSEQLVLAGLEPWHVQRVYEALPPGELGMVTVSTSQVSTRWGRSLAELAAPARGLVNSDAPSAQPTMGFRLAVDEGAAEGKRDFFSGIALAAGEARRPPWDASAQNIDELRRAAQARRNVQAILGRGDEPNAPSDQRWLAEVGQLTRGMDPASGAEVVFQLAQRYYHRGRWEQAADSFELLAQRYPEHPLAGAALVWLVQYYSSGEAHWRSRRGQGLTSQQVTTVPVMPGSTLDGGSPAGTDLQAAGGVQPATAVVPLGGAAGKRARAQPSGIRSTARREEQQIMMPEAGGSDSWPSRAAALAKQLEQLAPALYAEPDVRYPLAAAQRAGGLARQAERFYLAQQRSRPHDAWWTCAIGEQWLAEPRGVSPKSAWNCVRTAGRPRLDGELNDAVWRAAAPVELHSSHREDAEWPAVALAVYDREYLYLAASCRRAPGVRYQPTAGPRPRDADLSAEDRIEFLLDLDRDWTTFYRLVIDHRGWTAESCWHDTSWNPAWFVAAKIDGETWTVEAAIPLTELTGDRPTAKSVWAVGAQRIVPGVGFQSWTTPASVAGQGEGFGYLLFE